MKLARAPCAATSCWKSATKSASRSGATAVSSTNDAGRSAPGAPMRSGRAARRRAAASARSAGASSQTSCVAPSSPASARRRARPASASSSLPWYSTVSIAASSPASSPAIRRKVATVGSAAQRPEVEELDRRRPGLEDGDVRLERRAQGGERECRAHPPRGARVEQHLQLGEERERALRAGQQPAEVGLGSEQLAQVVAGGAAPRPRKSGGDGLAVLLAHPRERRREPPPLRAAGSGRQISAGAHAERRGLAAGEHGRDAQHLVLALAVHDRAGAGRVVADHAGDRRLVDGRGVRAELEAVRRRGRVERRLHHAGLDAGPAPVRRRSRGCGRA